MTSTPKSHAEKRIFDTSNQTISPSPLSRSKEIVDEAEESQIQYNDSCVSFTVAKKNVPEELRSKYQNAEVPSVPEPQESEISGGSTQVSGGRTPTTNSEPAAKSMDSSEADKQATTKTPPQMPTTTGTTSDPSVTNPPPLLRVWKPPSPKSANNMEVSFHEDFEQDFVDELEVVMNNADEVPLHDENDDQRERDPDYLPQSNDEEDAECEDRNVAAPSSEKETSKKKASKKRLGSKTNVQQKGDGQSNIARTPHSYPHAKVTYSKNKLCGTKSDTTLTDGRYSQTCNSEHTHEIYNEQFPTYNDCFARVREIDFDNQLVKRSPDPNSKTERTTFRCNKAKGCPATLVIQEFNPNSKGETFGVSGCIVLYCIVYFRMMNLVLVLVKKCQ